MRDIEIFTGPNCAYCEQAKTLMQQHGLGYVEHDVSDPDVLREFKERLPRSRALPQLFADGEHLGGLEDLQLKLKDVCKLRGDY